jgi:hypothetical protein
MTGYIKLFRKLIDWEWFSDANTLSVFIYLLLMANHEDQMWQGQLIRRGQVVTSKAKIAKKTGLTVQEVKTAFKHLEATNEITNSATNKASTVTIVKYSDYQGGVSRSNQQCNQQPNHKQEEKKKRRNKESVRETPTLDEVKDFCTEKESHVDPNRFYSYYQARGWKGIYDWQALLMSWEPNESKAAANTKVQQERLDHLKEYKQQLVDSGAEHSEIETVELNIISLEDAMKRKKA